MFPFGASPLSPPKHIAFSFSLIFLLSQSHIIDKSTVPSLAEANLDIANTSVYDVLREVAEAGINEFGVPELNGNVLKYVREFCGVVYAKDDPDNGGDESNLNAFADILTFTMK